MNGMSEIKEIVCVLFLLSDSMESGHQVVGVHFERDDRVMQG